MPDWFYVIMFGGLPGGLAGLAVGLGVSWRRLYVPVLVAVLAGLAFTWWGTTTTGENAGGWLAGIVAAFQLLAFFVGTLLGAGTRLFVGRRSRPTAALSDGQRWLHPRRGVARTSRANTIHLSRAEYLGVHALSTSCSRPM